MASTDDDDLKVPTEQRTVEQLASGAKYARIVGFSSRTGWGHKGKPERPIQECSICEEQHQRGHAALIWEAKICAGCGHVA
jgi:hypothetical protein